jgi:hypothetical protein
VATFKTFLSQIAGLGLSRAYDFIAVADGRTTVEELRKDARERQQKSRASKKKLPRPAPALKRPEQRPEPKRDSVTDPHVTETAKADAERRKAEKHEAEKTATESERALEEFAYACRTWLPKMSEADRHKALQLVTDIVSPKAEAA